MQYPGYQLNPGDMFSVDPERVLYATGARKYRKTSPETMQGRAQDDESEVVEDDDADLLEDVEETQEKAPAKEEVKAEIPAADTEAKSPKQALMALLKRAKGITSDPKEKLSGKRKQDLRAFAQDATKMLSRIGGTKLKKAVPLDETVESLEVKLSRIIDRLPAEAAAIPSPSTSNQQAPASQASNPQRADPNKVDAFNARRDARVLHQALQRAQQNPIDVRKPYATPWQPREYMSAFAFIPRYLEVNQNICSAVYLRHPVARPGLAEVPTPFSAETMQLAHNWYLRRR